MRLIAKQLLRPLVLALTLASSATAMAEIKIIYEVEPETVGLDYELSVDGTVKIINHIGDMPATLPGIASAGKDTPMNEVFNELIPLDWQVYVHHTLDDKRPISWDTNGENWLAALYGIGLEYDYAFDVNWTQQWVLAHPKKERYEMAKSSSPTIEVVGDYVPPGTVGHIVIDGKILKVRSKERTECPPSSC